MRIIFLPKREKPSHFYIYRYFLPLIDSGLEAAAVDEGDGIAGLDRQAGRFEAERAAEGGDRVIGRLHGRSREQQA